MTWPARVKRLEERVDDLEDVTFEAVKTLTRHDRRLDAAEGRADRHERRIERLAGALKRLRARVLGRAASRRDPET